MDIIQILKNLNAVITDDHFVYTSGKHGEIYVNKDALYPHTAEVSKVGQMFAEKYKDQDIDVVVGSALGGIILSTWVAYHLSQLKGKEVLGVYTEKDANKNQIFTRNYDKLVAHKNVLVIEDLTTTGGSVKKVVDTVRKVGGNVIAVCVMVNRNPNEVNSQMMGAPFEALGVLPAMAYDEVDCPFCKKGRPVNQNIGHGKKYMAEKEKS